MLIRKALTIAGSDSGGGAGIQADLKTFAALGVYGTSAITAVTAQNTRGVTRVVEMSPEIVAAQIDAVVSDIGAHALKTGMLANTKIINTVVKKIEEHRLKNLVVDPVMVATSGDLLIKKNAVAALRTRLIPLAIAVTPNIPEAEELTGMALRNYEDIEESARRIIGMGARTVVIKGGHRIGPAVDLYYDGKKFSQLRARRIHTKNTHGTGCTFSAAIAAYLARGENIESAVDLAKKYITAAIANAFAVGTGHGPVHHFHAVWRAKR
ncbi:MAG: bifunctional hydroxymethylpyrimidine kinase/phosphomethylpyrimidine kinase [Deltaproteobacteria bacterium]|nr:bifunctional hydroxymethylpyrimidine kinase/phosphomethylpyrimidine kinase [Deltaproteobacteria bacterium]